MGGLSFLNKKSWHTGTIKNNENVWIAQQKKQAEEEAVKEIQKKLAEERQMDDLVDMQAMAGHKSTKKARVDWMYEAPGMQSAEANEDFLTGKKEAKIEKDNDLTQLANERSGVLIHGKEASGGTAAAPRVQLNPRDMALKVREDPMLAIKKQEQASLQHILNNPVKMAQLKKQVSDAQGEKKARKAERKAEKKAAKKHKKSDKKKSKHKHKSRHKGSSSSGSSSGDEDGGEKGEPPAGHRGHHAGYS